MADWTCTIRGSGNPDQAKIDIGAAVLALEASGQTIHGSAFNSAISEDLAQPILDRREATRQAEEKAAREAAEAVEAARIKAAADAAIEEAKKGGKPEEAAV